jgi:hypothetical protein
MEPVDRLAIGDVDVDRVAPPVPPSYPSFHVRTKSGRWREISTPPASAIRAESPIVRNLPTKATVERSAPLEIRYDEVDLRERIHVGHVRTSFVVSEGSPDGTNQSPRRFVRTA